MDTPEGKVKKKYRARLKALGAYDFKPVQMGYGQRTIDDLCCVQGFFVGIEAKAPGEKPTPLQERTLKEIHDAGGIAIWGDDADEIIADLLNEISARNALGLRAAMAVERTQEPAAPESQSSER